MLELTIIIILVLIFDFINGFHDAANSIATVVSTRVLSPQVAVVWAAFFNFIAFLILGLHVANTVGKGIVRTEVVDLIVIGSGLLAAIIWNLLTWWWGIPSSSSHTMVGGFVGAAIAKAGIDSIFLPEVLKIISFIISLLCWPDSMFLINWPVQIIWDMLSVICASFSCISNSFENISLLYSPEISTLKGKLPLNLPT